MNARVGFLSKVFGGGNTNFTNNDNQDSNNNIDNNSDNNNQNNTDITTSFWHNNSQNNDQNNDLNNQNQNQDNNVDPKTAMEQHINSLNLMNGVDLQKIGDEIREGNYESLGSALQNIAANSYKAAVQSANKLIESQRESIKSEAVNDSKNQINTDFARDNMYKTLTYTDDPDIKPIANAVLKQAMSQEGVSLTQALQTVDNFFQNATTKINKNSTPPKNSNNNFNQNNDGNNDIVSEHEQWLETLSDVGQN